MAQQPMRIEKELCPTNLRFPPNKSIVRIDLEETQDEPLYDISLEILKSNTNKWDNKYFFELEYQRFKIGTELIPKALQILPRQPNTQFIPPTVQDDLVHFIKCAPKHGIGKGLMRKGDVPKPEKKKDVVPRCKRSITINDNVLSDLDEALKYATQVSIKEAQHQEKDRRTKHILELC
ncbi:hypothetical protein Tco_0669260 [Tanacetum coccineum]